GAHRRGGEEAYLDPMSRRLGGIAYQVAADIVQQIDLEIRVTVLGHVQRGGSPISFDRILATRFGKAAADLIATNDFGKMVPLRSDAPRSAAALIVAAWIAASGAMPSFTICLNSSATNFGWSSSPKAIFTWFRSAAATALGMDPRIAFPFSSICGSCPCVSP